MKKDIHPKYEEITASCSCGNVMKIRSTVGHDLNLDVCSKCHPFFTGTQKLIDTGGRVQRFADKFGSAADMVAKAEAEKKAEALNGVELVIEAKVSATGATYGSVNANIVAEELQKKGFEIDRKIITMRDIKTVGDFEATIHFHKEVEVKLPVKVVAENAVVEAPVEEAPKAEATEENTAE